MSAPCILVVEADIVVRSPLADYLRECGYRVLEAGTPAEARQLLEEPPVPVDIAMIDVSGEGGNGFELAAWIRRDKLGCEVVLAGTLAKTIEKAGDLCEEGPSVSKPYDHRLVLDRIRRLLAARDARAGKSKP